LSVNHRGLIAAARIFSTFEGPTDGSEYVAGDVAHVVNGDIKFESCSFSYPARPDFPIFYKSPTVNGVNLSVADKESIGLVGRSGCGKSTILQVVMRFYKIIGGSATLDGREFSDLNVDCLRKQIGYVGQLPRAIIRNPKILVLDEATAALDNESQKLVQLALDELQVKQPRTTLTVAHRLLTIKDCDKIAFLGDGGKQGPDHRKGCSHLSVN